METTSTPSNICNFNSIECNGRLKLITHNIEIPKSTESIISVGMYLCQIHYNQFILNEIRNINYNKSCEHPKHDEYKNQSKNTKKKSKKLSLAPIPIKKNNSDDNNNLQDESIETIQDEIMEIIQNESIEVKQKKACQHPKHDEYLSQSKNKNKQFNLKKIPIRLIKVLELDEFAMICNMCIKKTDKDSQYLQTEEYEAPIFRKNNDNNILKIGNHTYLFRKDILYTEEELQQLESDYQEIIT